MPEPEALEQAVKELLSTPPQGTEGYKGQVTYADESGAHRVPWTESLTDRHGRIKKTAGAPTIGVHRPEPVRKTSDRSKAEGLALRFVRHIERKKAALGRIPTDEDYTPEEFAALGLDLWRAMGGRLDNQVPDLEFFKRVAGIYLKAAGKVDARFTPSGVGFTKPEPERAKA